MQHFFGARLKRSGNLWYQIKCMDFLNVIYGLYFVYPGVPTQVFQKFIDFPLDLIALAQIVRRP